MKNAPILILDDALSAVDTDTEEHILHNLKKNRQGMTTILIAHRISTIQNADMILVLEDGEAKEVGNHAQLMEKHGIYRDMFEKQQLEAAIGEKQAALENEKNPQSKSNACQKQTTLPNEKDQQSDVGIFVKKATPDREEKGGEQA